MNRLQLVPVLAALTAPSTHAADAPAERYWPQWRGPLASGVAPQARPPVEWSETKNVRWKVEVPGRGSSSPIVWGDLVIVTTAVPIDKPLQPKAAPAAPAGPRNPAVSGPTQSQEFAVLDKVGRLQLPQEYLTKLSLKDLVRLELEPDHVQVHPTSTEEQG